MLIIEILNLMCPILKVNSNLKDLTDVTDLIQLHSLHLVECKATFLVNFKHRFIGILRHWMKLIFIIRNWLPVFLMNEIGCKSRGLLGFPQGSVTFKSLNYLLILQVLYHVYV